MKPYLKAIAACVALMLAFVAACAMCGCAGRSDTDMPTMHRFTWAKAADGDSPYGCTVYVVTDKETGTEYLVVETAHGVSVTPLTGARG